MNTHRTFSIASAIAVGRHALLPLVLLFAFAAPATADVSVAITVAPPALPVYVQPPCPGDGYLWTPGYWAWADGDYYWVPGTWVLAPEPGLLWTPGYWAWEDVRFVFHEGYWGPHVGFYGGINYGFGYGGVGFEGGYWQSGRFYYNRAVANVSGTSVHNVYTKTVIHNTINVVSYNGGRGGTTARPTTAELRAAAERHVPPVIAQREHMKLARNNPALRAGSNHEQSPTSRADSSRYDATAQREARDMQARHQKEREELRDRQTAEQTEMARQHVSEQGRQAMAAAHARQQQELARRHEQEEQEFEAQHKRRDPA
jgi:hypothetical protein